MNRNNQNRSFSQKLVDRPITETESDSWEGQKGFDEAQYYHGEKFELGGIDYSNEKNIERNYQEESSRNRSRFGRDHWSQDMSRKGPKGWKRADELIKEDACEGLWRNQRIDATEIEISVSDGVITMLGNVESREAKKEAEVCVENITGVVDVQNYLRPKSSLKGTPVS